MTTRRAFLTLLGGAGATWPIAARAQQAGMPVVGFLHSQSADTNVDRLRAFRQGLKDTGYAEGENLAIEYRWAEGQNDRLPELAVELVRKRVTVIVAIGATNPVLAAKAATSTIPIVFVIGEDPVRFGLVASLARPGGNLTGINLLNVELAAKRLELLRELVPTSVRIAVLVNPSGRNDATTLQELTPAARTLGLHLEILNASTAREIDGAFATFVRERPDALFVGSEPFFTSRCIQLAHLATFYKVPAVYGGRDYSHAGGLMSYGTNIADGYRQAGAYAGRILKGEKPGELPVVQSAKFELIINHQTARMLGIPVPPTLLATADEVIE